MSLNTQNNDNPKISKAEFVKGMILFSKLNKDAQESLNCSNYYKKKNNTLESDVSFGDFLKGCNKKEYNDIIIVLSIYEKNKCKISKPKQIEISSFEVFSNFIKSCDKEDLKKIFKILKEETMKGKTNKTKINKNMKAIIWTDGACKGNPGKGGWGFHAKLPNEILERYGGEKETTNNKMEMEAIIQTLKQIPKEYEKIVIYTDSNLIVKSLGTITIKNKNIEFNGWIKNWIKKNYKGIKNVNRWKQIVSLLKFRKYVELFWVKGHNGDPGNERADELANMGCDMV